MLNAPNCVGKYFTTIFKRLKIAKVALNLKTFDTSLLNHFLYQM